ncbi:hypothetical protein OG444_01440 [Streptomyces sp. NBC_01232]|uniref:hypothetical protein n=1 Tax=unclassified Streptomyces TaxID=2593676 RepID=UPI002E138D56|nr:hypothetical protein OG444_01440 [Streptomyces sp. NBC_01232]
MAENGMRVDAGGQETWAPVGIALALAVCAVAGLAWSGWARAVSWTVADPP